MATPSLQVVQQCGNDSWENAKRRGKGREQGPIPPGHAQRALIEPLQHRRPKVALEFDAVSGGQGILQQLLQVVNLRFFHGWTPASDSVFLKMRTPRKTRNFTALSEIPSASAMRWYGSSSTSASNTTARTRGERLFIARRISRRSSSCSPCGCCAVAGRSSGKGTSRRA